MYLQLPLDLVLQVSFELKHPGPDLERSVLGRLGGVTPLQGVFIITEAVDSVCLDAAMLAQGPNGQIGQHTSAWVTHWFVLLILQGSVLP